MPTEREVEVGKVVVKPTLQVWTFGEQPRGIRFCQAVACLGALEVSLVVVEIGGAKEGLEIGGLVWRPRIELQSLVDQTPREIECGEIGVNLGQGTQQVTPDARVEGSVFEQPVGGPC